MAELYAGESIGAIVLVTGFLGGGAAWLSGRAIAGAWHPPWHVALVALVLGAAARFIHFALFHGVAERALQLVRRFGIDAPVHRYYAPVVTDLLCDFHHFASILRIILSSFISATRR